MAIVAMAVVSSYDWAGFPFDNLCGTFILTVLSFRSGLEASLTRAPFLADSGEPVNGCRFGYCSQVSELLE
jgi:hypothetical protein